MDGCCHDNPQESLNLPSRGVYPPSDSSLLFVQVCLLHNQVNELWGVDLGEVHRRSIIRQENRRPKVMGKVRVSGPWIGGAPQLYRLLGCPFRFPFPLPFCCPLPSGLSRFRFLPVEVCAQVMVMVS